MKQTAGIGSLIILLVVVAGCGGPGHTVPMVADVKAVSDVTRVQNAPRVAVMTFEDVRSDKTAIGRYQHYVETTVDRYVPAEGSAADQITQFVVNYLHQAGFPVTLIQAGAQPAAANADVILTGQIESYWNQAVARLGRTELYSKNRLRLKLTNLNDNSTTFATVVGEGTSTVISYNLSDLVQLNDEALAQSLERFLSDTTIVDRSIKPKRQG